VQGYPSTIIPSAGAPKFSGSITEQHADNKLLCCWIVHLWTHIGVEFTQYVRCTPGDDTLAILVFNLLFKSSNLPLFFLITPFSPVFGFLFL